MDKIPVYSIDLIKQLDEIYPPRPPQMHQTDREIWMDAGKRQVVELLLQYVEVEQDEDNQQDLPLILEQQDIRKE